MTSPTLTGRGIFPENRFCLLWEPQESVGQGLCTIPSGTGVNKDGRMPKSRYGDADAGKGPVRIKYVSTICIIKGGLCDAENHLPETLVLSFARCCADGNLVLHQSG